LRAVIVTIVVFASTNVEAAAVHQQLLPDPGGPALSLMIWYPSAAQPEPHAVSGFHPRVAVDALIKGRHLPLIIISHGTRGTAMSHYDTAIALADAGFVVASLTHSGDNYNDQSRAGFRVNLIDRPRQVRRVIDYMLHEWPGRERLDLNRVGMFGFSLGGFDTLVAVGAVPDILRFRSLCTEFPEAPDCEFIRTHGGDELDPGPFPPPDWVHDPRVKAAVIAAPAASFAFGPGSLAGVTVPVQLWTAEGDQMAPARWNSDLVRKGLPTSTETRVVPRAGHMVFLTPEICDAGILEFDCTAFHREMNAAIVRFFSAHLSAIQAQIPPPQLDVYTADQDSAAVTSTLIFGTSEAILVDAQFHLSDAKRLADRIDSHHVRLNAIIITHAHEDHYIGLAILHERFPDTPILMSANALQEFRENVVASLAAQKKYLPAETPDTVPVPGLLVDRGFRINGNEVQILGDLQGDVGGSPSNAAVWIPSLRALIAGDLAFDGVHPWLTNSDVQSRARWKEALRYLQTLRPQIVVCGHKRNPGDANTSSSLAFTIGYLDAFDAARAASTEPNALIATMRTQYPELAEEWFLMRAAKAAF
jgi:predicted dienelactone hydrolase